MRTSDADGQGDGGESANRGQTGRMPNMADVQVGGLALDPGLRWPRFRAGFVEPVLTSVDSR